VIISVIIPTYNEPDHLQRCVRALWLCDYRGDDYEVVIVDDASTDHTRSVMQQLETEANSYNRSDNAEGNHRNLVCLYHEENKNAAAARNTAILHCRKDVEVLAFIDQDCTVPNNWLTTISIFFQTHPEVDYTGGYVSNDPKNIWQEWAKYMSHQICDHEDFQTKLIGTNMAFRQKIFWDNFFDESVGYGTDETELVFRLSIKGFKFQLCKDLFVNHYHRDSFLKLAKQRWKYGIGEARFYWKYGFGIYHPVNTFMLKTHISFLLAIALYFMKYPLIAAFLAIAWIRYIIKYARMRYTSFLHDKGLPLPKVAVFIMINWVVDTIVLLAKLWIGNPI
jgi:glycosyltransferase involved in cell wall biosynthesis